jgi:hypothetical protein
MWGLLRGGDARRGARPKRAHHLEGRLGTTRLGGFTLSVSLDLHAPRLSAEQAAELVLRAHERCPVFERDARKRRCPAHRNGVTLSAASRVA